jgi:hypothetical protein
MCSWNSPTSRRTYSHGRSASGWWRDGRTPAGLFAIIVAVQARRLRPATDEERRAVNAFLWKVGVSRTGALIV